MTYRYLNKINFLIITSAIGGCSYFAPTYQKPQLNLPQNWQSKNKNVTAADTNLPYLAWWHKFNDPLLNQLIESGLVHNANIQSAQANLEASQAQLSTIKLNWIPMVSLFGGYVNGYNQIPAGNLGSFIAIMPQYTINFFNTYTQQKQAEHQVKVSEAEISSVKLAVIGQITAGYFAYMAQLQTMQQLQELKAKISELVDITVNLNKRGLATEINLSTLKAQQKLITGQIILVEKNLIAAQNALHFLLNQAPGALALKQQFASINPNQVIPGNLPVAVIAARPDVIKAEEQLKAANEGISVASSNLLPSVSLNSFFAQTNNNAGGFNLQTSQTYSGAYANWTISPSVFGQIDTSKAIFKVALINYKNVVNNALHEVDNSLANNNSYNKKMQNDLDALAELDNKVKLQNALYQRGVVNYMSVITVQTEQLLLQINLTETKLQQLISLVSLYQNLGGGYNYNESSAIK